MQYLTREQMLAKLRDKAARCGGQSELARQLGVTRPYITMLLSDKIPGDSLVKKALGLERVRDLWTEAK
jgi:DNA-binding phage protein